MTYDEFQAICDRGDAPKSLPPTLFALWQDYQGDWDGAHTTVQGVPSAAGSLVHAYLHRKEGDLSNAQHWYNRAEATMPDSTMTDEWQAIARQLCE